MLSQILPQNIPFSTIFILSLAGTISLLTSLANRLLTKPEQTKAWRKEISEWNSDLRNAQREGDKKRVEKLMKNQKYILQIQSKMMWQSLKVTLIFIAPLFIIWQVIGGFYGSTPIAYFPGVGPILPIPIFTFSLLWWYLLCSYFFSTLFSHVFGLVSVE